MTTSEATDGIDPELSPFIRAILDQAEPDDGQPLPHAERRARAAAIRTPWVSGGPAMARVRDLTTDGGTAVRIRVYEPATAQDASRPALVYVHGGGWVLFSLDTHDRLMREYAARAGTVVVGVDYSLSPEVRFPVALHEVVAAVDWTRANAAALGVDPARVAIGGDSAGANLSLAACLVLRDRGDGDAVAGMMLNYGFFDDDFATQSHRDHGSAGKLLTTEELDDYLVSYLGEDNSRTDPLALPARAALHDLPPSLHVIAACDPLADGDRAMAARMRAAGNRVEVRDYAGATHSFLEAMSISRLAGEALDTSAQWLRALHAAGAERP